mgnify:CR=1 FL=1
MNCIIVDDEPLAREAIEILLESAPELTLVGTFGSALAAQRFLSAAPKGQDIRMPSFVCSPRRNSNRFYVTY